MANPPEELDRTRLAADIHDYPVQHVMAALMHLEVGRGSVDEATRDSALETCEEQLRLAAGSLRRLIDQLWTPPAAGPSASQRLKSVCAELERVYEVSISCHIDCDDCCPAHLCDVVHRSAAEALRNACRHAHAQHVRIDVEHRDDAVVVEVSDDGIGFPQAVDCPGELLPHAGTGTTLACEHVRRSGGRYRVRSVPQRGSTVRIELPIAAPATQV